MIDIHCHYLPGIDDGAKTMHEALDLARAAVANGIECAIMTPHIHPSRYDNVKISIATATEEFRSELEQACIPLQIGYAAEVRLAPEILPLIESNQVPFLGEVEGYQLMLLEFPHSHIPLGADKLVDRLLEMNIRPIIAHPERNKDVMRDLDKISPFVDMGCLLQLTAASIVSRFGDNAHKRALQLLESDADLVIATDSHNLKARPPILREAMEAATEIVGHNAAHDMVNRLPRAIVASQFLKTVESSEGKPVESSELKVARGEESSEVGAVESKKWKVAREEGSSEGKPVESSELRVAREEEAEEEKEKQHSALVDDELRSGQHAGLEARLLNSLKQYMDETIPVAIERALDKRLVGELGNAIAPGMRQDIEAGLKADLAAGMQAMLSDESRGAISADIVAEVMADVMVEAKSAVLLDMKAQVKNALQHDLQQQLLATLRQTLQAQPDSRHNVDQLLGELSEMFEPEHGSKTEAPAVAATPLTRDSK